MKILAIASKGGHWIQLLRLIPAISGADVTFVSTHPDLAFSVKGQPFFCIPDGDRLAKIKLFYTLFHMFKIVFIVKPDVILTTGSAPGLMGLIAGKLFGSKTIWVDSIANVTKMSASGKIASSFADRAYTQWPNLATKKILFSGNILS